MQDSRPGPWPQTRIPLCVPPEQLRNLARLLRAVAADATHPASVWAVATDTNTALRASGAATEPGALAPGRGRRCNTSCFGLGRGHRHEYRSACLRSSYGTWRACSGPWPRTQDAVGAHVLLRSGPWPQTRNPRNLSRLLRAVPADARILSGPWPQTLRASGAATEPGALAPGRGRGRKMPLARTSCFGPGRGRRHETRGTCRACSGPCPQMHEFCPDRGHRLCVPPEQLRNLARLLRAVAADASYTPGLGHRCSDRTPKLTHACPSYHATVAAITKAGSQLFMTSTNFLRQTVALFFRISAAGMMRRWETEKRERSMSAD